MNRSVDYVFSNESIKISKNKIKNISFKCLQQQDSINNINNQNNSTPRNKSLDCKNLKIAWKPKFKVLKKKDKDNFL